MKWNILVTGFVFAALSCSNLIRKSDEITRGERLYRSRCTACHTMIKKEALSHEGWELAIRRYESQLSEEEKKEILRYLLE